MKKYVKPELELRLKFSNVILASAPSGDPYGEDPWQTDIYEL